MCIHEISEVCGLMLYSVFMVFHFTEKKYQHHPDDDSGVGPSIFTDTKSTTFSEVSYNSLYEPNRT